MYVCICKGVTDGQIKEAINRGACTRKELVHCLGVGRECGKCHGEVRALLHSCTPNQCHEPSLLGMQPVAVG